MAPKEILLTPGPTHIPPAVLQAMLQPTLHHRTEVFKRYFREATDGLRHLLRSEEDPIFISGSGTAAMEAALLNICSAGDEIVFINAGKFGERWGDIAARLSIKAVEFISPWGSAIDLAALENLLAKHKGSKAVCLQYCETSTAAELPVVEITSLARKILPEAITIVDAISAIGTRPIYPPDQNIDILVGAGHKGLMLPPGLAFLDLSRAAWARVDSHKVASLYFDLKIEREQSRQSTTAWTPAMNHIVGLCASLKMIQSEGEDAVYHRHTVLSDATKGAIKMLGLEIFSHFMPSTAVTAAVMPAGIDGEAIRKAMREEWGVRIAGGQEELKGKIVRFGHMGYVSSSDIIASISAFESALLGAGHPVRLGSGVAAACEIFKKHF